MRKADAAIAAIAKKTNRWSHDELVYADDDEAGVRQEARAHLLYLPSGNANT